MNNISDFDLGWLCGLIEGEGCCRAQRTHGKFYPFFAIRMTDEDVISKAVILIKQIINTKAVASPSADGRGWQTTYGFQVHGNHIRPLLELIYPYMSEKKQSEIEHALDGIQVPQKEIEELLQVIDLKCE